MSVVAGIVLGAGASTRMGVPKQDLAFGPTTLLGWVVGAVEASTLDRVVVVVRPGSVRAWARAEPVVNAAPASGCASSLQAGLDAIGSCDAVMVMLGDMPGVDAAVIDTVRAAWEGKGADVAVTSYRGELGHPLVFSAAVFPDLRSLHGDKAVWKIVDREGDRVQRVEIERALPPDIDTEADYRAAVSSSGSPARPDFQ